MLPRHPPRAQVDEPRIVKWAQALVRVRSEPLWLVLYPEGTRYTARAAARLSPARALSFAPAQQTGPLLSGSRRCRPKAWRTAVGRHALAAAQREPRFSARAGEGQAAERGGGQEDGGGAAKVRLSPASHPPPPAAAAARLRATRPAPPACRRGGLAAPVTCAPRPSRRGELLLPRTKGFVLLMKLLRGYFHSVMDMTIGKCSRRPLSPHPARVGRAAASPRCCPHSSPPPQRTWARTTSSSRGRSSGRTRSWRPSRGSSPWSASTSTSRARHARRLMIEVQSASMRGGA